MDWNGTFKTFVSRPQPSLNFLYNYNFDQHTGVEIKHPAVAVVAAAAHGLVPAIDKNTYDNSQEKKKRPLTSDQLDSLERSFQEDIKLDSDRKMKLSRELGLQPRQIAIWFQNRRARWKAKQLERLYDALKQEYDAISREKQKLQDEVMKLKGMLIEQATRNQVVSKGYTEIPGEETVGSTSIRSFNKPKVVANHHQPIAECNYLSNADDYNLVSSPYWGAQLPSYP